jgi:hypothetical protein
VSGNKCLSKGLLRLYVKILCILGCHAFSAAPRSRIRARLRDNVTQGDRKDTVLEPPPGLERQADLMEREHIRAQHSALVGN